MEEESNEGLTLRAWRHYKSDVGTVDTVEVSWRL